MNTTQTPQTERILIDRVPFDLEPGAQDAPTERLHPSFAAAAALGSRASAETVVIDRDDIGHTKVLPAHEIAEATKQAERMRAFERTPLYDALERTKVESRDGMMAFGVTYLSHPMRMDRRSGQLLDLNSGQPLSLQPASLSEFMRTKSLATPAEVDQLPTMDRAGRQRLYERWALSRDQLDEAAQSLARYPRVQLGLRVSLARSQRDAGGNRIIEDDWRITGFAADGRLEVSSADNIMSKPQSLEDLFRRNPDLAGEL
jgi:hypothetical protein